jgi:hypothetical protein
VFVVVSEVKFTFATTVEALSAKVAFSFDSYPTADIFTGITLNAVAEEVSTGFETTFEEENPKASLICNFKVNPEVLTPASSFPIFKVSTFT